MYTKFNKLLQSEAGITWKKYIQSLRAAGNESGVYPDVALLLYRLVAHPHTKTVLEFGSGMSTCIMAKAATDHGKEFAAMEHHRKWYDVTASCMRSLGIKAPGYVCTDSDPANFSKLNNPADVVWVDGPIAHRGPNGETFGREESCTLYKDSLKNAVLLFDDAQLLPTTPGFFRGFGRDASLDLWFNPTGRADRQVFISFPTTNHPLRAVVDSCVL